jgi:hypothetical protein
MTPTAGISLYTQSLSIEKPATGAQPGTWGITANNNYDQIDSAIQGSVTVNFAQQPAITNPFVLTTQQGASQSNMPVGANANVIFTGTLSADGYVMVQPGDAPRIFYVSNQCIDAAGGSAQYGLIFSQGDSVADTPGATFTLDMGQSAIIYADGAGASPNVRGVIDNPQFNNVLVKGSLTVEGQYKQNQINLDTTDLTSTTYRQLGYTTDSVLRWTVNATQQTAGMSPGWNDGSDNFQIRRFDDDGSAFTVAGNPAASCLYITRATGNVTIGPAGDMRTTSTDLAAQLTVITPQTLNKTVLHVVCQPNQVAPAILVQDTTPANKFAVDAIGNVRIYGSLIMWSTGAAENGWTGTVTPVGGPTLTYRGGVLVGVS